VPKPPPRLEPPADRTALTDAEAALKKLEDNRKSEEAEFRRRLEKFKAEQLSAQEAYVEARKAASAIAASARRAYRAEGGRD